MITGEALKKRRLALGFKTQREFSEALGIARPTLRGWEQGQKKIPMWAVKFLECLEQNEILRVKDK
jgi:DNA-binding transcriptional regulator YiaG